MAPAVRQHPGAVANTFTGGAGMAKATDGVRRAPGSASEPGEGRSLRPWNVSPSDLTFLLRECPRCFFNKIVLKQTRPASPFPKVFGVIDRAMKRSYQGKRTDLLVPGAPAGVIDRLDRWVQSAPIAVPGSERALALRGRLDALVSCDDGTNGLIDFKTSAPGDAAGTRYATQLHAYALALGQPSSGRPIEISTMGLLCFAPDGFVPYGPRASLSGELQWVPIARNDKAFTALLTNIVNLLNHPNPPPAAQNCRWCQHSALLNAA
jgi:hypothetical protein